MTTYAKCREISIWLGKDLGADIATKWFGKAIIDSLPRYIRGKNKGKHKATLRYMKCESGGWVSRGSYHGTPQGFVRRPGDIWDIEIVIIPWGQRDEIEVLWRKDFKASDAYSVKASSPVTDMTIQQL